MNKKDTFLVYSILCFITIIAISCSSKKTEKLSPNEYDNYSKILNGDLSAWEGTWVNGHGERVQLKPDGTFNDMETSKDFQIVSSTGNNYMWENIVPGEFAYDVYFFPKGIEFVNYYGNIQTDITKDRIYFIISAAERITTSNDIYYSENDLYAESEAFFAALWAAHDEAGEYDPKDYFYLESDTGASSGNATIQIGFSRDKNFTFRKIHEFEDEGNLGDGIAITSDITLNDFSFIAVDYDYEADSWIVERTLFSIPELKSSEHMEAFQANTNVGDGIPSRGISFTDGNRKRYFYISESGVDGSLSLTEFQLR